MLELLPPPTRRERWANGGGWTRPIATSPGASTDDGWTWRLSVAESDGPARFSTLPGVDRVLVLLSGAGLDLRFDDGAVVGLTERGDLARFAGEQPVVGTPTGGATEQLNLMWRRSAWRVTVDVLRGTGRSEVPAGPRATLVWHVVDGSMTAGGTTAGRGGTLVAQPSGARTGRPMAWAGTVAQLQLSPRIGRTARPAAPAR